MFSFFINSLLTLNLLLNIINVEKYLLDLFNLIRGNLIKILNQ